ncbi:MAG: carboxylesterase family protein [Thiomicrospira sp.]|nr:carboxylesterase family protein [Thiomicrospira sp.]
MTPCSLTARMLSLVFLLFIGQQTLFAADAAPASVVVTTDKGDVRGLVENGLLRFKGIPYAQAPSGELRWQLPQPAHAWSDIHDATQYASACPQLERYGIPESSLNEDCLALNITLPFHHAADMNKKRPVIVWIHGGAFVGGSSGLYSLDYMAELGDVVVVSMNYRLGVLGFTAHPAFDADHNGGYGLEDQRAALRWVQNNIAAFGGDPDNVTVAGESAGGASVCMHLLAPNETQGLFHKAIVQSAGCATPLLSVEEGKKIGDQIGEKLGCDQADTALTCLRAQPVKKLLEAASEVAGSNILTFMPVIGTQTAPTPGAQAIPAGDFVQVPVLYGGTQDELRLYVAYAVQSGQAFNEQTYAERLREVYGDHTDTIMQRYPLSAFSSAASAVGSAWSDFRQDVGINHCIYLESAKLLRKFVPVYQFNFADRTAPAVTDNPGFEMGAVHSSELIYQFPGFDNTRQQAGPKLNAEQQALADKMMAYFTHFAATGVPRAPNAPDWNIFDRDDRVMNFQTGELGFINQSQLSQCDLWKSLYPHILTQ